MKIETEKKDLEPILQKAARLAGKHLTLPVLSCIYLEAKVDNKVTIKSTNLDIGLEIDLKAKVLETGSVAVPASVFLSFISSVNESTIEMEVNDNNLKIKTKHNSGVIKCMPSDDFPSIPKIVENNQLKISSTDLLVGFKSVWYSASNSNIKPELGSVYVFNGDDGLTFVSTDSFRLAEKKVKTKVSSDFPAILIPYKNVSEIMKIFENYNGEISLIFEKNQAAFITNEAYVVSRLVDGSFPNYNPIIPKTFVATATVLKNDLINAIKTSNIFSDTLNQIKFKVDAKNKSLILESKNNEVGEYQETIKSSVSGDDVELNFNSRYVIDCMQTIAGESIDLNFGGVGRPLLISGVSDKSFMYIVMPMNR